MGGFTPKPLRPKSEEQPKVKSQMKAVKPEKPVAGPTDVEMDQDLYSAMENKKRGRRRTVLSSITGDTSKPQLSTKTLLG